MLRKPEWHRESRRLLPSPCKPGRTVYWKLRRTSKSCTHWLLELNVNVNADSDAADVQVELTSLNVSGILRHGGSLCSRLGGAWLHRPQQSAAIRAPFLSSLVRRVCLNWSAVPMFVFFSLFLSWLCKWAWPQIFHHAQFILYMFGVFLGISYKYHHTRGKKWQRSSCNASV